MQQIRYYRVIFILLLSGILFVGGGYASGDLPDDTRKATPLEELLPHSINKKLRQKIITGELSLHKSKYRKVLE